MHPLGKLPVTLELEGIKYTEDFHIYSQVNGAILSWKAAKGLNILPQTYPYPATRPVINSFNLILLWPNFRMFLVTRSLAWRGRNFTSPYQRMLNLFVLTHLVLFRLLIVKAELDLLQTQGIIAPVTEPTEWCAPIVVAPKKNSQEIRLCVDSSHLNKYVRREKYQSLTPAQAVADIAADNAKIFTKIDARKGYHQCPLDKESQILTTFITPFGRFKYLRAPYGISSISEHYNRRMDEALNGLSGFRRIVDDIVIYDNDVIQHESHVRKFLQRCSDHKITLNTRCKT